jgi:uncharacterized membrane protein/protein-disulfide isomerase
MLLSILDEHSTQLPEYAQSFPHYDKSPIFCMLNRIALIISLLGVTLALHLWIQKERDFDQGCWGLGEEAVQTATGGCHDPRLSKESELFGVSTAALGYAFYLSMVLLTSIKLLSPYRLARGCQMITEILVGSAFLISLYLVYYQIGVAHAICPLCMVSFGLTAMLFFINVVQWKKGIKVPDNFDRTTEIGYISGILFGGIGLLITVLVFVDGVATRRIDRGSEAQRLSMMVRRMLPTMVVADALKTSAEALKGHAVLKFEDWKSFNFPTLGAPDGVRVVLFLDPNCPHCRNAFKAFSRLAEKFKDKANFTLIPRPLWDYSTLQIQALDMAKTTGRYYDLWQKQFENQKRGGLELKEIRALLTDVGLPGVDREQLEPASAAVRDLRLKAAKAGINATPSWFINDLEVTAPTERDLFSLTAEAIEKK